MPREMIDAPFQKMFKVRLDNVLNNLKQWKVSLLIAMGVGLDNL